MSFGRLSVSLIAAIGIAAATVAGATIWLLLTDPIRSADAMATAVSARDLGPFMRALGDVIYDALRGLFGYL